MSVEVYHGGTDVIARPDCTRGRAKLDFGRGFYVTEVRQQACEWAVRIADRRGLRPMVNVYTLDKSSILAVARCKVFSNHDLEWLQFIAACRQGLQPIGKYDYIEGGIANDRVIDTVELYLNGLIDADSAIGRLVLMKPNMQICLASQELTDRYLRYERTEKL